jgi:hypothetical protein
MKELDPASIQLGEMLHQIANASDAIFLSPSIFETLRQTIINTKENKIAILNYQDQYGNTPLHVAIIRNLQNQDSPSASNDFIEFLKEMGANTSIKGSHYLTVDEIVSARLSYKQIIDRFNALKLIVITCYEESLEQIGKIPEETKLKKDALKIVLKKISTQRTTIEELVSKHKIIDKYDGESFALSISAAKKFLSSISEDVDVLTDLLSKYQVEEVEHDTIAKESIAELKYGDLEEAKTLGQSDPIIDELNIEKESLLSGLGELSAPSASYEAAAIGARTADTVVNP